MSDLVIVALITVGGPILTIFIKDRLDRKRNKALKEEVAEYHKEVNGKMTEFIATAKALGNAEGQAEQKEKEDSK